MVKHFIPSTLEEALDILATNHVTIIAGGTDIMVQRRSWANTLPRISPSMNILHLSELNYIKTIDNALHIGATTPLTDLLCHADVPTLLKQAIQIIASPALRNVATIAGNIGNASPAGDTLPILYLYDAIIVLTSSETSREVPIQEVITGPRQTTIADNEMITEIILPVLPFSDVQFDKVGGRKADAISKVSFTGAAHVINNKIQDIRFCFGAVGPVMIRNRKIEKTLLGRSVSEVKETIDVVIRSYQDLLSPIDDQRSTKQYRQHVALNLLRDFMSSL